MTTISRYITRYHNKCLLERLSWKRQSCVFKLQATLELSHLRLLGGRDLYCDNLSNGTVESGR